MLPENLPWVSLTAIFAHYLIFMLLFIYPIKTTKVDKECRRESWYMGHEQKNCENKKVIFFLWDCSPMLATEQGVANWTVPLFSRNNPWIGPKGLKEPALYCQCSGAINCWLLFWDCYYLKFMDSKWS